MWESGRESAREASKCFSPTGNVCNYLTHAPFYWDGLRFLRFRCLAVEATTCAMFDGWCGENLCLLSRFPKQTASVVWKSLCSVVVLCGTGAKFFFCSSWRQNGRCAFLKTKSAVLEKGPCIKVTRSGEFSPYRFGNLLS